MAIFVVNKIFT